MQRATLLIGLSLLAAPLEAFGQVPTQAARNRARTMVAQASSPHGPPGAPSPQDGTVIVRPKGPAADDDADFEARKRSAKFSFEFSKAEVVDIVKAISDMTRQNFIIPERVKGQRITILSPTKITASEAYQVFHTALAANGISIVRTGRFYKLLDAKEAIKDTVPTCVDEDGQAECALFSEQMVTALMRLRHVDAAQINTVARSLLSKDGDISIFQPSNALIISEYAPNLKRVRRIIDALDVPGFDDELRLVQIQYSSATEISEKLTQVFDVSAQNRAGQNPMMGRHGGPGSPGGMNQGSGSSKEDDNDVQISKIIPDDRTNQIIIKANRRSFDAIRHLVAKLDVPIAEGEQGRVHVYYLENAKAEDLASTLSSLAQGTPAAKKGMPQIPGGPGLVPGGGNQRPNGPETTTLFEGEVKITADKATNSLLVMASAHDYRSVRSIVEKLDMPRRQVYVEAAILEVNLKDDEQFGLNFHDPLKFGKGDLGPLPADGTFGFLQSVQTGSAPSPTFTALTSGASLLQAAGGAVGGIIGKGFNVPVGTNGEFVTLPSFGILLKWLTTTSNANILSTPHILTTDNEQAKIEVGEKIPFNSGILGSLGALAGGGAASGAAGAAAGLASGLGGGLGAGLGATQIQRIDVSLKLTLTPQINERNKIRLEIEQVVEDVTGKEQASQTPTTSHRSIKTVVVVDDQQTIVLGGLVKDSTTESESKIPLLGDLPILGWLFKQHSTKMSKTNLMLILTPYIISSADDFQRIFERKMQEHEEFAAEYYGHRKEFRAHVDYKKKSGPLGRIVSTLRRERTKFENGGDGDGSESLIQPQRPQTKPSDMAPGAPMHEGASTHHTGEPGSGDKSGAEGTDTSGLHTPEPTTNLPITSGPISEAEPGAEGTP